MAPKVTLVFDEQGLPQVVPVADVIETSTYDPYESDPGQRASWENQHQAPHFLEGQREYPGTSTRAPLKEQWDKVNAERWGDSGPISVTATGLAPVPLTKSSQLARASTPRPVVWLIQLNAVTQRFPVGAAVTVNIDFRITIGCGMSRTTIVQRIALTAANGFQVPPGAAPQLLQPGQDVQVDAVLVDTLGLSAGQYDIDVAAMCAPFTRWD